MDFCNFHLTHGETGRVLFTRTWHPGPCSEWPPKVPQARGFPIPRFLGALAAACFWQDERVTREPMGDNMFFGEIACVDSAIDAVPTGLYRFGGVKILIGASMASGMAAEN